VKVTRFLRQLCLDQGRVIKTITAQPQLLLTGVGKPYEAICRAFFRLGIPEHVVRVRHPRNHLEDFTECTCDGYGA
jgi:hypothetical protein